MYTHHNIILLSLHPFPQLSLSLLPPSLSSLYLTSSFQLTSVSLPPPLSQTLTHSLPPPLCLPFLLTPPYPTNPSLLRNSYHGTSPYSQGLTGLGTWKYPFANGFGIHNVRKCVCLCSVGILCVHTCISTVFLQINWHKISFHFTDYSSTVCT